MRSPELHVVRRGSGELISRRYGSLHLLTPREVRLMNLQVLHQTIQAGARTRMHYHSYEEVAVVLEGKVIVRTTDDRDTVELEAGDAMVVPANCPHSFRNEGDAPCRTLIALSPPRSESSIVYLE
jgi:quercetin dioxygenase-like cupin family protein